MKSTASGRESQTGRNPHREMSKVALVTTTHHSNANPLAQKHGPSQCIQTSHNGCQAFLKQKNRYCGNPVISMQRVCAGHGGLSTGPRTEEGLAKIAALKTTHGRETRALRALRSQISHNLRRLEEQMYAEGLIHGPRTRGRKPVGGNKKLEKPSNNQKLNP